MTVKKDDWLSKILNYVNSPFRLFAVILMSTLGFAGFLIYKNTDMLIGVYKEHQRLPDLAENRIDEAVSLLFKYTKAEVVAIFKVNPMLGTRVLYKAYTRDGRDKTKEGIDVGLFTSNINNNRDVVALMAGETPCGEYLTAQSEVGIWYIENGMRFGCRVSVPPDNTRFIGQITVGWKEQPQDLAQAKTMLQIAANILSKERR